MAEHRAQIFYVFADHEKCGGEFIKPVKNLVTAGNGKQQMQSFQCSKCGIVQQLPPNKWPHQKIILLNEKGEQIDAHE